MGDVSRGAFPGAGFQCFSSISASCTGLVAVSLTYRSEAAPASRRYYVACSSGAGPPLVRVRARLYGCDQAHRCDDSSRRHRAWPRFGDEPFYLMLAATVASTLLLGQAGEEVGWRGYALPRLAERFGLPSASVVLGIIWAAWHLPLFFIPGIETTGQSFPLYLVGVTALSTAIAWLYSNTSGSLSLTMLMHAAINNTKDIVPTVPQAAANPFSLNPSLLGWITAALLWICAGYFLIRMRGLPQVCVRQRTKAAVDSRPHKLLYNLPRS